jgi:hypothetical protein
MSFLMLTFRWWPVEESIRCMPDLTRTLSEGPRRHALLATSNVDGKAEA